MRVKVERAVYLFLHMDWVVRNGVDSVLELIKLLSGVLE